VSLGFLNERLRGNLVVERLDSRLLRGNPLGDPHVRHLPVYLPPAYHATTSRFPLLLALGGLFSSAAGHVAFRSFDESPVERLDRLMGEGELPPCLIAFPDCATRFGGSQYLDSSGTGLYQSHLVDELLPWLETHYRVRRDAAGRAVAGRSSGGFGALRLALDRPGLFAHCASSAGDLHFQMTLRPELARAPSTFARLGGLEAFLARVPELRSLGDDEALALNLCALATSYAPCDMAPGFRLPIDLETGELDEELFARWRAQDPAERVLTRDGAAALGQLTTLHIEAGDRDEYHADLGARVFARRCRTAGIHVDHVVFPGGHRGGTERWEAMLRQLLPAMAG